MGKGVSRAMPGARDGRSRIINLFLTNRRERGWEGRAMPGARKNAKIIDK